MNTGHAQECAHPSVPSPQESIPVNTPDKSFTFLFKSVPFLETVPSSGVLLQAIKPFPALVCVGCALSALHTPSPEPTAFWLQTGAPAGTFPLAAVVPQHPVRDSVNQRGLPEGIQTNQDSSGALMKGPWVLVEELTWKGWSRAGASASRESML